MKIDIEEELLELQGIIPEVRRSNFHKLESGNIAAKIPIDTSWYDLPQDEFDILIEYREEYPEKAPKVWLLEPELPDDTPHVCGRDDYEHARLSLRTHDWTAEMTSHDVVVMIKEWISSFETWNNEGTWVDSKSHDTEF